MDVVSSLLIVVFFVNLVLGFFIVEKDRKSRINLLYGSLTLIISLWSISIFFFRVVHSFFLVSLFTNIAYISVAAIPLFFVYFSFLFFEKTKIKLLWHVFLIGSFLGLSWLILGSDEIIKEIVTRDDINGILFGRMYILYAVYLLILFSIAFSKFLSKYKTSSKSKKIQIRCIVVGAVISISLATFTNFVLFGKGMFEYNWVGPLSTVVMVVSIAYAISKHHLFNIKVITTELLVGITAVILAMDVLLSASWQKILLKLVILISFLYLGFSLIKSVLSEINRRKEVERMSEKLQKAYYELKKLDAAKTEFISIASHQLRTPLTIIKGYISMILEGSYGKVSEEAKKPMKNIFESNERLIRLVNDLLTVSKMETGKIEVEFEKAFIEEIISSLIAELKLKAREKGLSLKFVKPKTPLPEVFVDREKIRQAIFNIIDNAIRYTSEGGVTVKVKTQKSNLKTDKEFLLIKISDTGEGMTREEVSKLFVSFSRGSAGTKFWVEGAGLGLYIAKKFIDFHNGKIWAESPGKGKGSTFYIELPLKS